VAGLQNDLIGLVRDLKDGEGQDPREGRRRFYMGCHCGFSAQQSLDVRSRENGLVAIRVVGLVVPESVEKWVYREVPGGTRKRGAAECG
jgi:hypothetical protein